MGALRWHPGLHLPRGQLIIARQNRSRKGIARAVLTTIRLPAAFAQSGTRVNAVRTLRDAETPAHPARV